jgi:DHA1 family tetracycline resistance protein-like MFS transporter
MGIASMVAPLLFTQLFAAAVGPYREWNLPGIPFLGAALLLVGALVIARRAVAQPSAAAAAVQ